MNIKHIALSLALSTGIASAHPDCEPDKVNKKSLDECITARLEAGETKKDIIASLVEKLNEMKKTGELSPEECEMLCADLTKSLEDPE